MALTLSTLGSVTALTIDDSACIEADGTYDLIFTGDNTTPATGTYIIASNVITSVSLTSGGSGYSAAPTVATQSGDGSVTASFMSLASAQDSQSRHPLVEIVSAQKGDDIPFDGTYLTPEIFNEYSPSVIAHSSGRLCLAYPYGPDADDDSGIKYVYTDTDRTVFTTVTIELYTTSSYKMKSVSICEMTDGNIGIVCMVDDSSANVYRILRRIVTVTGVAVSNAEIANWSHGTYTSDPWVSTIAANSYLLVYGKISGADYYIYKRTSADFATWSAEGALSIGGLTSTWRLANPSILKISTGDLWLWFDALESTGPLGEELTNVYYSVSSDAGANWANAVKVTAYTGYGEIGLHPTACQKVANQMHLLYTRRVGALHLDDTATGWPTGDTTVELSWDSVNRKLYAINCHNGSGYKILQCVVKIDVDTWEVDQYWDETTTPGFPSFITDGSHYAWYANRIHDGHHVVMCCVDASKRFLWHLDCEENTITNYYLDTDSGLSILQNVTHALPAIFTTIKQVQVDVDNNRIYLYFSGYKVTTGYIYVGYIDLTETSGYELHEVINIAEVDSNAWRSMASSDNGFYVDADGGRVLVYSGGTSPYNCGILLVYDIESGGELYRWDGVGTDADFPYNGIKSIYVYGAKAYAGIHTYYSGGGQSSYRGLVEIDLVSGTIAYHRPSYCSDDDHYFSRPNYVGGNKIAMVHDDYGVAVFDMVSHTWEIFNNANIPGMTLSGVDLTETGTQIAYDAASDLIFVGDPRSNPAGVIAFSVHGYLRQSYYSLGTDPGGGWGFATASQLVQGYRDYEAVAVPDPGDNTSMYCFWTSEDTEGAQSIKWDKDGSDLNLSEYLIDDEIALHRTIDGNPATLSFSVSHGHLFDPYNSNSLLGLYLKKGRKLTIRWGELISGTEYWHNGGVFSVMSGTIRFVCGEYPIMKIEADDQRALWRHSHVYATDIYSNTPEEILSDLMQDIADMALGDIDIPTMDGSATIDHQWIETTLDEIVTQICNRFGYYYRFDVDGDFSARKITNVGSIDHTYTDLTKIIEYSPDDKYSDFTNRVTVTGQERDFTVVIFPEERVAGISGTIGWWGCSKEHVVWFSYDQSRRVVNPRLVVLETATSIPMRLAGDINESLTECPGSGDNKYCTVEIEAPNLIAALVANTAGAVAASYIPDISLPYGGPTIAVGRVICQIEVMLCTMILGSTANYQYDIYGQPLGSIRRSVQATADDTENQAEIGCVVEQKIEDPLCYSSADCAAVAAFELMVAQMQRKRVTITKVAHLQDEDGDTIRFKHPISGQNIDLFVTDLRRRFKKGKDGYFLDEIDGWVVNQ